MAEKDILEMKKYGESYYVLVSKSIRERLNVETDERLEVTFEKTE